MGRGGSGALYETKVEKSRVVYRIYGASMVVGICLIWFHRGIQLFDKEDGRLWLVWVGLFGAELWSGFYWLITQSLRWNRVYNSTFKDTLHQRYENELPKVDIFVCTADHTIEPPMMVINTVLSVMAYDYPPEKLSVYLSDDGGSDLTYYALLEASRFSKHWIPYCKKFEVEPRSPTAYFSCKPDPRDADHAHRLSAIKKLYQEMENQIEAATKLGRISEEMRSKHEGFSKWDSFLSKRDHDTILLILLNGRDSDATDIEGCVLPTLVYLAREKRPQYHHNFKAGAMNALIRVSSEISNGKIILNVDCDMYSNNSHAIRDALCFFMDEEKGNEIAYVQFPQNFENVSKNDLYGGSLRVISEVEFHGIDGYGGPLYIGSGCFHRRDVLCGLKFSEADRRVEWKSEKVTTTKESVYEIQERVKGLADCSFEENTQWGKEMGLKYGSPVEDVITGLSIQCRGWKSKYFNPARKAFLGVAPTTLAQTLVQHKRWSEGDFQIFLSKYCPLWQGYGKISLFLQMGYCSYCFWVPNSISTLFYSIIPSLFLLRGIPLFPQVSSPWFIPYVYVIFAEHVYSLVEFLCAGGSILGWWNEQRIWLFKRTSSYFFAFIDTILKSLGFSDSGFVITAKVTDGDVTARYEQEIMEFGTTSPMFTILATLAMLNLFCLVGVVKEVVMGLGFVIYETMVLQIILCGVFVLINWPLYQGLFFRSDRGKMPSSLTLKSIGLAMFACTSFVYLY